MCMFVGVFITNFGWVMLRSFLGKPYAIAIYGDSRSPDGIRDSLGIVCVGFILLGLLGTRKDELGFAKSLALVGMFLSLICPGQMVFIAIQDSL